MIQQELQWSLRGRIKTQIVKQVFKDLGPKNLKGVQTFYAICSGQELNLQFMSTPKDILITIILKKSLFQTYDTSETRPSTHKYSLEDFTPLAFMFENNKSLLQLEINHQQLSFTQQGPNGKTQFVAQALNCDPEEAFLISDDDMRPLEENCMRLRFNRVGMFQGPLAYAKAGKISSLWLRYDSVTQKLQITDGRDNFEIRWLLKVEQVRRNAFNSQMQFPYKILSCAINLLPNDSPLILTLYGSFMLLDVPEREKIFTIRINAKHELD